jgi:hypothetical protein
MYMTGQVNVIERHAANGCDTAAFGNGVWTLIVLTRQGAAEIEAERRAQEDAAIDAEDILTQAEEANAFDPVG